MIHGEGESDGQSNLEREGDLHGDGSEARDTATATR